MNKEYVTKKEDVYRIGKTRVSLDSVVYEWRRGASAESIQRSFPALTLEEVYGTIAFYLANEKEINQYLQVGEDEFAALEAESRAHHQAWYERLQKSRRETLVS
ncbi:MAG TPA: DUF433 domain-containing protein [Pyrinomonadaceae bacterium]|jgi:uncharacterized protein (DUF433 family)